MALSITVHGQGTFTASMKEGPVSFTAAIASVGPKGDKGDTGDTGVVAATAPIVYTPGTKTMSMDTAYFIQSPAVAATDGQIPAWDAATSRSVWIDNSARTLFITARNTSGVTIPKRSVVYISGGVGSHPIISLAKADAEATSAQTIGITAEAIANNGQGQVVTAGQLQKVDTSAWTEGTGLYLSASTAGGFSTTLPTQPNHGVYLGVVTRKHAVNGVIEVTIRNYQEMEELSDVLITSRTDKDLIAYDSASGVWKNKSFSTLDLLTATTAASTYQTQAGMSSYAPLASPTFTGDPKAPTPSTSDNDTSIATTAFVNAYCPAASTSVAGKVQLATVAEAVAGTDASKAVTAAGLEGATLNPNVLNLNLLVGAATTVTSGTGAAISTSNFARTAAAPTTAIGYALQYISPVHIQRGYPSPNTGIQWNKRIVFVAKGTRISASTDSNTIGRLSLGKTAAGLNVGDLIARGISLYVAGNGALVLQVHNGTTLTNVTSSFTPATNTTFDIKIVSDGAGNVTLFVNDSQVATTSAGPTTSAASLGTYSIEAQNTAIISTTPMQFAVINPIIEFST